MKTRKLTLEISDSLFQKLEELAELTEESIDDLAIQMIASNIYNYTHKAKELKEKLEAISPDNLPEIIDNGELSGVEIF